MDENKYINDVDLSRFNSFLQGPSSAHTFYRLDELPPIEDLFPEHIYYAFIFIQPPGTNIGHWTSLIKFDELKFEYFDCLGAPTPPELLDALEVYSSTRGGSVQLDESHRPLMARDGYICGKWCIFRVMCLPRSIKAFHSFFKDLVGKKKGITPDSIVDFVINIPYGEEN